MSNITKLALAPALPSDLPDRLRRLAEDVEAGRITEMAVGWVEEGNYCFMWPSSLADSLVLATLMQGNALERMRR